VTLLAAAFTFADSVVAAGGIWLSSTNSLTYLGQQTNFGSGSITNPYYGDFDYIMGTKVPANTVVHLGGGVFWTKGSCPAANHITTIPSGVTIQGDGQEVTTIKRSSTFTNLNLTVLGSTNSGISVKDLTLDCNGSAYALNSWSNAIIGIELTGSEETLEHVTDINGFGYAYGLSPEGFQLYIGEYGQAGNKVIGCTVSNFFGQYGDGVTAIGDCLIEGNHVFFTPQPAGVPQNSVFGINVVASSRGTLVIDNYVYGGKDGFHNDTGGDNNLVIANNVFENVCVGVNLTGDQYPYNSVIIFHNLMTQQTNYTVFHDQMFVIQIGTTQTGQTNLNIVVDGNIVRYYKDVPFTSDGCQGGMYIYGGPNQLNKNLTIINNQIDARMPVELGGNISNLYATGNIPLNGTNFAVANENPGLTNFVLVP